MIRVIGGITTITIEHNGRVLISTASSYRIAMNNLTKMMER